MKDKQSQEQINFLAAILRSTPVSVIAVNMDGKIEYINVSTEKMYGYTSEELIGRDPVILYGGSEVEETWGRIMAGIKEQGFWRGEMLNKRKNGEIFYIQMSIYALLDSDGKYLSLVGFQEDITDRKRAEEERKRLEEQFQKAQKMEAVAVLARGVAHDFNNILNIIHGHVSLLGRDFTINETQNEHLERIEEMIHRGAGLVRQFLNFTRGTKNKISPIDLNSLIAESTEMFGSITSDIQIFNDYDQALWVVEADSGQIEQVLINLYLNAWQAMAEGGELYIKTANITIDKTAGKSEEILPGNYVKVTVTDTGIGMDRETEARIFEPYFTTKEAGEGTGLGLTSVYRIIKEYKGFIEVFSVKDKGTTFSIYLPATK
ncbi:MAG TPA: PAS domain S-box protein [Spirochaetales bacterium]|nr:PAS domain S-box protein [Spirochaetales bacterium]